LRLASEAARKSNATESVHNINNLLYTLLLPLRFLTSEIFSRDFHSKLLSPRFCVHIPDFHTIVSGYRRDVGLWKRRNFLYDISIQYRYIFTGTGK
jgi:hypothetical protein